MTQEFPGRPPMIGQTRRVHAFSGGLADELRREYPKADPIAREFSVKDVTYFLKSDAMKKLDRVSSVLPAITFESEFNAEAVFTELSQKARAEAETATDEGTREVHSQQAIAYAEAAIAATERRISSERTQASIDFAGDVVLGAMAAVKAYAVAKSLEYQRVVVAGIIDELSLIGSTAQPGSNLQFSFSLFATKPRLRDAMKGLKFLFGRDVGDIDGRLIHTVAVELKCDYGEIRSTRRAEHLTYPSDAFARASSPTNFDVFADFDGNDVPAAALGDQILIPVNFGLARAAAVDVRRMYSAALSAQGRSGHDG